MTTTPKRRLPVFSIRTLLIVMTLLCAYAACWWPTKVMGTGNVDSYLVDDYDFNYPSEAIAPLVLSNVAERQLAPELIEQGFLSSGSPDICRRYYLWIAGFVVPLPIEQDLPPDSWLDNGEGNPAPPNFY